MKHALVCGAGGFIGSKLVTYLKSLGYYVVGADLKFPVYSSTKADEFYTYDLRDINKVTSLMQIYKYDEIYQLAADMGGAGYIFIGENDADIMHNSATINLNMLHAVTEFQKSPKILYTSSACMYPEHNQLDPDNPLLSEDSAYPANPDSEYGWEKLFSERLYLTYARCKKVPVRIARLHNIFGPEGSWNNGKEKSPAAICRKVALADNNGTVEIWGPGTQTRSFLYIDECVKGLYKLMQSDCTLPLNLGSEQMISINDLVYLISRIANKTVHIKNVPGPVGVMGRRSDNNLIKKELGWSPDENLEAGLQKTYHWISKQLQSEKKDI